MKIIGLVVLTTILMGCGKDCSPVLISTGKKIISPWQEKVACPNGEVMLSANTLFWMNGDLKGTEIECARLSQECR